MLDAIGRIVRAEAAASGAERDPEITEIDSFPVLTNDEKATARTMTALGTALGPDRVFDMGPVTGSEDVGLFATDSGAPICYWMFGGLDPEQVAAAQKAGTADRDVPANHSPFFAPLVDPTLTTGVTALTTAALEWLAD